MDELKGKIRIAMDGAASMDHLQLAVDMLQLASNEPAENVNQVKFYMRKAEIAALIAIAKSNRGARGIEEADRSATAWEETAAQNARNVAFYHDLLERVGKIFGIAARTSDDGSIQDDVLCLKVPELVEAQRADLKSALKLLKLASPHIHYCEHSECVECKSRRAELSRLATKYHGTY